MPKLQLKKEYEKYPAYKDSGVEWIGKIPKDWELKKMRHLGMFTASGIDKKISDGEKLVKMVNYTDVYGNKKLRIDKSIVLRETTTSISKIKEHSLKIGDILFTPSSETEKDIGVSAVVLEDMQDVVYSYHLIRFRPRQRGLNVGFSRYFLNNNFVLNQFSSLCTGTTRMVVGRDDFKSIKVVVPDIDRQEKISKYLDEKTVIIDQITEKKQKLIKLLREKRTAVVNNAVTKGLDPKAELVESGVEWIGKIPKGWSASSLKTLLQMQITDGPHTTPKLLEDGVRFISAESIQANNTIDFNKNRGFISLEDHIEFCKKTKPQRDDIFMVKSGATTGRIAIVETDAEFSIWSPLALIRTEKKKATPKYIYYFLQSGLFQDQVKFSWSFGTQQNIGMRVIENLMIVYPSMQLQKDIAGYLDTKMPNFDIAIQKIEKSIELLNEFKTSLISNVVTGKVKV